MSSQDQQHFSSFPLEIPPAPPLHLRGEFSIRELVAEWKKQQVPPEKPQVLFDLPQLRYEYQLAWEKKFAIPMEEAKVSPPVVFEVPELPQLLTAQASFAPLTAKQQRLASLRARAAQAAVLPAPSEVITLPGFVPEVEKRPSWKLPSIAWPEISLPQLRINWFSIAGNFALSSAVALTLLFGGPIVILETQSLLARALSSLQPQDNQPIQVPVDNVPSKEPVVASAEDVFSISIPSLNISSAVIANVDAGDEAQYTAALKEGIAHAKGSALPDQLEENKTIYLFAHSTDAPWNILRYNAQFYALKDAEIGSEITIRFWGEDYTYKIEEKQIIEAHDTSLMQPQSEQEKLVLQTCFPPGTAEKRLVVIATPIEANK